MDIRYSYTPVPTCATFARSDAFIRGLIGPFGSGKSSACVAEIPRRGQAQAKGRNGVRKTRWAVIRNTFGQLEDTTIPTFHQWLPPAHFGRHYVSDHRYLIKNFEDCEIEVLFRALDRPEHVRNLLSLDLTGAWINEAREIPWAIVEAMQGRVGRFPQQMDGGATWAGIFMDTNPPDTDSRWYKFFEERDWLPHFRELERSASLPPGVRKPEDFAAIFHQPSGLSANAENLANLRPGYYRLLQIGKKREWIKVYVMGEYGFVSDDKAVFTEYSDAIHQKEIEPIPERPIRRGWDFGLTPACSFSQILPNGRFLVFNEMCSESMGIERFADEVLNHCARSFKGPVEFEDYGDPAGDARAQTDERTCFEILRGKGVDIEAGEVTLAKRLEAVRYPMTRLIDGEPAFILHRRCKNLRKGFLGAYHYRRMATNSERYTTEPEKNEASHIMDALEYDMSRAFGGMLTRDLPRDDYPQGAPSDQGRSEVTGY
jgi:hypothetical protein